MKVNVEKVKFIADDAGWFLLEDRPHHYFCRFVDAEDKRDRKFTMDVYYSKKGSVRLKQKQGNSYYFRVKDADALEDVFENPYTYYKAAHTILK